MTFAMSTEGDSVKSALSEANDKNATDNNSDESSQDSIDTKEVQPEKPVENNVNSEKDEKPKEESTEGESEQESETSEKKEEADAAPKNEEKKEMETDNKSTEGDGDVKKDEKEAKSEEDEEGEEEKEEPKKEEKPVKETKKAKETKEKDEKASTASEKDEEEEEEEAEDEEEAEEATDKKGKKKSVPLLDQPLETSGKRERKNVQRFEEKDPGKIELEDGSGTPLGEIPRVEASITRFRNDDLKFLHKLLFKVLGNKNNVLKKNIKKFNGFAFKKDSDDYKKKVEFLKKTETKQLKTTCEILDLEKTGTKDEIVDRIMDFLMEPKDSGKPVGGTGRPKRASAVRANNRGLIQSLSLGYSSHDDYSSDEKHASRARRDKGKRANLKEESSSDEEFKPGDASDASDEKPRAVGKRKRGRPKRGGSSDEDDVSLSPGSSDESDDAPKSKRRKSVTKANSKTKPKTPGRRGRPSTKGAAAAAAATPKSKTKRGRKPKDVSSDEEDEEKADDGSSSEDVPLAKKKAKLSEPPTDEEIKTFIKSVLEGANLEEITMKTVCQRVYDNYPDFDLTARKNFIKSTVKSLIST